LLFVVVVGQLLRWLHLIGFVTLALTYPLHVPTADYAHLRTTRARTIRYVGYLFYRYVYARSTFCCVALPLIYVYISDVPRCGSRYPPRVYPHRTFGLVTTPFTFVLVIPRTPHTTTRLRFLPHTCHTLCRIALRTTHHRCCAFTFPSLPACTAHATPRCRAHLRTAHTYALFPTGWILPWFTTQLFQVMPATPRIYFPRLYTTTHTIPFVR